MVQNVESGPTERERRVVASIYFWFGVITLLPWNAIINAKEYWMYRLRNLNDNIPDNSTLDVHHQPLTDMQMGWHSNLSMAAMIPNLVALLVNTLWGQRMSVRSRVIYSLAPVIAFITCLYVWVFVNSDSLQYDFYICSLILVGAITSMVGIYQGAIADVAGRFPPMFMGSVLQGEALGGVLASSLSVLMILFGCDGINVPKYTFPIVAACVFSAIPIFVGVSSFRSFTFYANGLGSVSTLIENPELDAGSRNGEADGEMTSRPGTGMSAGSEQDRLSNAAIGESSFSGPIGLPRVEMSPLPQMVGILPIMKKIWVWAMSIFINFTITLSFFPSVAALVQSSSTSQDGKWATKYFTAVACFLNFNSFDLVGRVASSLVPRKLIGPTAKGSWITMTMVLSRTLIAFLLLHCNVSPLNRTNSQVWFKSDGIFIALIASFGLTNGLVNNITMMNAPKMLGHPQSQGRAAITMLFCLFSGLALGSGIANIIVSYAL